MKNAFENVCKRMEYARNTQGIRVEYGLKTYRLKRRFFMNVLNGSIVKNDFFRLNLTLSKKKGKNTFKWKIRVLFILKGLNKFDWFQKCIHLSVQYIINYDYVPLQLASHYCYSVTLIDRRPPLPTFTYHYQR